MKNELARRFNSTTGNQTDQYGGRVRFAGRSDALYERHLAFDQVVSVDQATVRDKFEAAAHSVRDVLSKRWIETERAYNERNVKRVYFLSMEFLLGRALANNFINLGFDPENAAVYRLHHLDPMEILEQEPDPGLGNGGLGRLAACFLDSLATLSIPAMGYGLRYEYGLFRQTIENGWQTEKPDHWLARPDPWEVARPDYSVEVKLNCSFAIRSGSLEVIRGRPSSLIGIPYDRPVVGYGGRTVNTLRLWSASTPDYFNFAQFSSGDYVGALAESLTAETLTRVLYPDDSTAKGKGLRFVQEYFLTACSLGDIVNRLRASGTPLSELPQKAAIQLNDTHPTLAVPELMRLLLDEENMTWDQAWSVTQQTLGYTNHTLLPEALEKWPVAWFEVLLPRHLEIIYEINSRFLCEVRRRHPNGDGKAARVSIIEEGANRQVRMANLAVLGTHSTNGVAELHSRLVRESLFPDFEQMFPERFNNKTNGVTPRRWLLLANRPLATVITEGIGESWVTDLDKLERLKDLADDKGFAGAVREAKRMNKNSFANWLKCTTGISVDPDSIFDTQIKRIHEYKRQLLNALHIVVLYNRLRTNPNTRMHPHTFLFGGKAAPAYHLAKLVIKFINNVAGTIDGDPTARGKLKVVYVPDYRVSVAERLIPASDVSEQLSTAGYEASGTSNMKFMMNGALTIGTRDGATIEMSEAAGEENFFLFGLTAQQVEQSRGWYNPWWHYENEPEIRAAIDLINSDHFSRHEPGEFKPLVNALLNCGDHYRHLADLSSYAKAHQHLRYTYEEPQEWTRKVILNIAASGRFSSDRTIKEYARDIWNVRPVSIKANANGK